MTSKWAVYDTEIKEIYLKDSDTNGTLAAKVIFKKNNIDFNCFDTENFAKYINRNKARLAIAVSEAAIVEKTETTTETNQYFGHKGFTAISPSGGIMDIETYCKFYQLDFDKVKSFKLVSHTGTPYYNIAFFESEPDKELIEIDFLSIFKDKIKPVKFKLNKEFVATAKFDRAVFTDAHVAMNVNPDGFTLYPGEWNKEELNKRGVEMVSWIVIHQKAKRLILQDLGDFMDGYNSETVRGGHHLPQNMDNQKAFDVGFWFKINLAEDLLQYYDEVEFVNICDDNHAGSFGYIVNSAFKSYIELKYPDRVKVINQRKFIDHYFEAPNHYFILTHGKDGKNLKFGFKPILDDKQVNKINEYIDEFIGYKKGMKIEFGKGDSHQYIFDNSTSTRFLYQNFPAFSPPSNWVKTNFKNTMSGFLFFNYYKNGQKSDHPYVFKM
jgi:hypothetical protein